MLKVLKLSALCRRDTPLTRVRDVIGWWEARRIPFNLIVGSAGVLTCFLVGITAVATETFGTEFGLPDPPVFALFGVIAYAIAANLCFTGGWLAELVVRRIWPAEADRFATLSLSTGVVFSVLLTLAPGVVIGAAGLFQALTHVLRNGGH